MRRKINPQFVPGGGLPETTKVILLGKLEHKSDFLKQISETDVVDIPSRGFNFSMYTERDLNHKILFSQDEAALIRFSAKGAYAFIILQPDEKLENDFVNRIWSQHPDAKMVMYKGDVKEMNADNLIRRLDNAHTFKSSQKQKAEIEVRKNARIVDQGGRDKNSIFSKLPADVRKKIAAHTGEPTLSEGESREISRSHSGRPNKKPT